MERRDLIKQIAMLTGGAFVGAEFFLANGCKPDGGAAAGASFTKANMAFLDEVAETIIPATNTPGAKAAGVGTWMTVMVNDCYDAKDQQVFKAGMAELDKACEKAYSSSFMNATPPQRTELLTAIDKEARAYADKKKPDAPAHYFTMMKQLTLLGYFTSKEGATQALRYEAVPGKYIGDVPYKKGDKAWAT
jgi:hypothetical protein